MGRDVVCLSVIWNNLPQAHGQGKWAGGGGGAEPVNTYIHLNMYFQQTPSQMGTLLGGHFYFHYILFKMINVVLHEGDTFSTEYVILQ